MQFPILTFFLSIITLTVAEYQLVLNPQSSITTDIRTITHEPSLRTVDITLKEQRVCQNPTFLVRLSGTALHLLHLTEHRHVDLKASVQGVRDFFSNRPSHYSFTYPPLIDTGVYFIEILVLLCSTFDPNDYKHICLVSPQNRLNVVNLPYNFTFSENNTGREHSSAEHIARWVYNQTDTPRLLHTRYQARRPDGSYFPENISDLSQHRAYEWIGAPDWLPLAQQLIKKANSGNTTIPAAVLNVCFIGASHARGLVTHGQALQSTRSLVKFTHIDSKYPRDFQVDLLTSHKCSYAIIGYGQWPVSYIEELPYTQDLYRKEMRAVLEQLVAPAYSGDTQIFIRSMNYNSLGGLIASCSPLDHRSPPVVDMLNSVSHSLATEIGVDYINLRHIIGPLWDASLDWGHPTGKVFTAEAEWVLHHILTSSIEQQRIPLLTSGPLENSPLRFSDDKTVYLYSNKQIRAFPNGHTFMQMGYDFEKVAVEPALSRGWYDVGEELPRL